MSKKKFYAYVVNGKKGIIDNWPECQRIVAGASAKYKGFESKEQAQLWLDAGANYSIKTVAVEDGIYFDSGTGAGNGVEINVTDKNGKSLLHKVVSEEKISQKGHHYAGDSATNNYGELLACKYALQIALKDKEKKVFGDSKLVIEYWSKGYIKYEVGQETVELANEVKKLRKEFEATGGQMIQISGGSNPADLGFHKG